MNTKRCPDCGVTKPESDYHKSKRTKDGLQTYCKECHKKRMMEYNQTDEAKQKRSEREKKYYWNDDSGRREYLREWRQSEKGKEMERERSKVRYQQRKEEIKAKSAVARAVKNGVLPHISEEKCSVCGEQAEERHHHMGYDKEHWLDVIPLCRMCHRATY